jgi:hypothetical protein
MASGCAWVVAGLLLGSDAGQTVPVMLGLTYGGVAVLALGVISLVLHLVVTRRAPDRRGWRRWAVLALAFVLCVVFVFSGWAFRVRFLLSLPPLDAFVATQGDTIASGQLAPGTRVGLFWVREAEALPGGVVRLITTPCVFDDCGVAYSPGGTPPRIGEDVYSKLSARWYHWFRSW